ncbi:hypothetical protein [uncultured Cohaesibacter sp.]|uniref:hypothetical protein n=1 Tax=uncultured Cohaesibacter sp. TaxID=1002546 RepID=UPI002AA80285|nr:hypothetical protein [uncultured Cohaesibacter sp.]
MADYYAILKRAVEAVPTQTREQRQTIYDKARKALLAKLQNMDPPLPPADISKQRMALEEAVRAVERDLSGSGMSAAPAQQAADDGPSDFASGKSAGHLQEAPQVEAVHRPKSAEENEAGQAREESAEPHKAVQTAKPQHKDRPDAKEPPRQEILEKKSPSDKVVRRAGQDVFKNAVRDANALGQATNKAVKHAQDAADAVGEERDSGEAARIEPTLGDAVVSQSKTYKRPSIEEGVSERPGYDSDDAEDEGSKSRFGLIAIAMMIVVVVIGSGYLLYANRNAFLLGDTTQSEQSDTSSAQSVGKTQSADDGTAGNPTDMAAKSVRTITVTPPSQEDGAAPDEDNASQTDSAAEETVGKDTSASSGSADLSVAQRSILYEEPGGEGEPGSASAGEVLWSLEGEGDSAVVVIDATIPDKKMSFHITMKKNQDAELPASHLIEISATHADADPSKAIVKIPGLILKPTEQSRGEGLVGASIRIADDLHWVALTSGDREERYNLELLHLRGWIDIPIQYETGRRAILTLEKGEAGDQVITRAIKDWSGR